MPERPDALYRLSLELDVLILREYERQFRDDNPHDDSLLYVSTIAQSQMATFQEISRASNNWFACAHAPCSLRVTTGTKHAGIERQSIKHISNSNSTGSANTKGDGDGHDNSHSLANRVLHLVRLAEDSQDFRRCSWSVVRAKH